MKNWRLVGIVLEVRFFETFKSRREFLELVIRKRRADQAQVSLPHVGRVRTAMVAGFVQVESAAISQRA